MIFDALWKRLVAWGAAFALGLFAAAFFCGSSFVDIFRKEIKPSPKINYLVTGGDGCREGCGASGPDYGPDDARNFETSKKSNSKPEPTKGVKILTKPRAAYTDQARANQIQGKVVLRVTFGANRQVGAISVISGLPDGLTEAAKESARQIKFEPAMRGNVPYSVTKPVEYPFIIY